jgi:hypothetical protein
MLSLPSGGTQPDPNTKAYTTKTLKYGIINKYNINASKNDIRLEIKYKGYTLVASTNFTFVKTGQDGTNGTDFVCRIDALDSNDANVYYLTVYLDNKSTYKSTNWKNNQVQGRLFKDGSEITTNGKFSILKSINPPGKSGIIINSTGTIGFTASSAVNNEAVDIIRY